MDRIYDWDDLFSREGYTTLTKGKDYDCLTHSMAQQIRNEAKNRRVRVTISITETGLSFRVGLKIRKTRKESGRT